MFDVNSHWHGVRTFDVAQTDRCTAYIALLLIHILDQPLLHVRHSRYFLLLPASIAHNAVIRTNRVHLVHQLLAHYCWMTLISQGLTFRSPTMTVQWPIPQSYSVRRRNLGKYITTLLRCISLNSASFQGRFYCIGLRHQKGDVFMSIVELQNQRFLYEH